jgi:hypothetical protein
MNEDPNYLPAVVLQLVEARLLHGSGEVSEESEERYEETFTATTDVLDRMDADDLRYAFQLLSDVAWDLADGWARACRSTAQPLRNIRHGCARGW